MANEKVWFCNCGLEFEPDEEGQVIKRSKSRCLLLIDGRAHELRLVSWATVKKVRALENSSYSTSNLNKERANDES
jgi:hypothetical protein